MGEPPYNEGAPWPRRSAGEPRPADGGGAAGGDDGEPAVGGMAAPGMEASRAPIGAEPGGAEEVDGQVVAIDASLQWREVPGGAVARNDRTVPAALLPAVAAGSFVAGAAVVSYVHRRRTPPKAAAGRRWTLLRRRTASAGTQEHIQIVGTRSVLLDVHLLGRGR